MHIGRLAIRVWGLVLLVSVGGLALIFLALWAIDEYSIRTGHYLFTDCDPPSLTEVMAREAVEMAAREVLGINAPKVKTVGFTRQEDERWPTFTGTFSVLLSDGITPPPTGSTYWLEGNGCGVEITDPSYRVVVNVGLPKNSPFSVRRGNDYQKF